MLQLRNPVNLTRGDVIRSSPSLARWSGRGHSHGSASTNPTKARPLNQWHRQASDRLAENRPFPVAWGTCRSVRIQGACLKSASDCLRKPAALKKRDCPFCSAGPNPAPALGARKFGAGNKMGVELSLDRSINNPDVAREVVYLYHARRTEDFPASHGLVRISLGTGKLLSEEGRPIFTCTPPFCGGRCRLDSETDNDVHVNLGTCRTVLRGTARARNELAGAPLHLLNHNAAFRHKHRIIRSGASSDSWMRRLHLNLPVLTFQLQDLSRVQGGLGSNPRHGAIGNLAAPNPFLTPPPPAASTLAAACSP